MCKILCAVLFSRTQQVRSVTAPSPPPTTEAPWASSLCMTSPTRSPSTLSRTGMWLAHLCFTWQECKLTPWSFTCGREVWGGDWFSSVWIISSRMERDIEILRIDRQGRWSGSISALIVLTVQSFSFWRRTGCCRDHYLLSFLSPAGTFSLLFLCNEVTLNVLKKKFFKFIQI